MGVVTVASQRNNSKMEFGAEGRKFFCFRSDGRRQGNKTKVHPGGVPYPIPQCGQALDSIRARQVYVTEAESVRIGAQVRYQERKKIRQGKEKQLRAQQLLKALALEDVKNGL